MMTSVKNEMKLRTLSLALATVFTALMAMPAQAELTGNIAVVSKYVLRGITKDTESDVATLQGGFDWSHKSGVYVGYWGSGLDYVTPGNVNAQTGFENDVYAGYKMKAGPVGLKFGAIHYLYNQVSDSDATEAVIGAGMFGVLLEAKYLVDDVVWGNKGDIYITADYSHALPNDFKLAGTLGYYVYQDSGKFIASSAESSAFRHINVALSHPLGKSGADMTVTYILGGKDRQSIDQKNAIVLSLSSAF